MFGTDFYHSTFRAYVIAFGQMFDDVVVRRYDNNNVLTQLLTVPIAYGPKERYMVRSTQDPLLAQQIAVQLPRLGFEITNLTRDPNRQLQQSQFNVSQHGVDRDLFLRQYVPVAWDISFSLYAFTRFADDGTQITEQVLPWFKPAWTNRIKLVPEMGISMDIPCQLDDVNVVDTYEGDYQADKRSIVWTFSFTMKAFFFGQVQKAGVIKRTMIDLGVVSANNRTELFGVTYPSITDYDVARTGRSHRITVQPGLLANGVGTTNSAASISRSLIAANSDWKYASNTFFYTDGLKYNPKTNVDEVVDDPLPGEPVEDFDNE